LPLANRTDFEEVATQSGKIGLSLPMNDVKDNEKRVSEGVEKGRGRKVPPPKKQFSGQSFPRNPLFQG
jgi:hypothetical protein